MFISRVKDELKTSRLNAEYYSPQYIKDEVALTECDLIQLDKLRAPHAKITYGILKPNKVGNKYRVAKAEKFDDMFISFDDCEPVSKELFEEYSRSEVKQGDVLIAIGGYVGRPAIVGKVPQGHYLNINRHIARLRVDESLIDPYYLVSFLSSQIGSRILTREITGSVQAGINLEDLRVISVPMFDSFVQTYIGNKVCQAELLRALSKKISKKLEEKINSIFSLDQKPDNLNLGRKINSIELTENRLDPQYYGAVELWAEHKIMNGMHSYKKLSELTSRIKDGPGGWGISTNDYIPSGVPIIRSVNLIEGECDLSDCVYISKEKHKELKSHEAKPNSVLLSVRGTVGRSAVFNDIYYKTASLNAAVVTIDCKKELNPYFLSAFLNSEVGRIQANRIANGAVQLNMNLTETGANLIPLPPENIQNEIELVYKKLLDTRRIVSSLTSASKLIVEALIEGQITEAQLIQAQQALDEGNNNKDKVILNKLTDKGYLAESGKPLFNDLDKLYELLDEAKVAMEVDGELV
jgi:type I restriction enzyme S subunit